MSKKKKFKIVYLPVAQEDLLDILDYIKKDNPAAAVQFIERIDKTIGKLSTFPYLGKVPKDDRLKVMGYRMLIIDNFIIFYVVKKVIEIRRVIHGSRRYEFLL